ncbi:MAG: AAA family ATPase [Fibrobacter sp.]|uniref:AAA family ATPase n=1 Tax=Fibrobacter sp. TaxID=35828 RepID=UPI002A90D0A8|nr:AAA family ATPase [Fibrobacter sp.]MDY6263120.1 AAA family ATPase [Fibrobacter sp.]
MKLEKITVGGYKSYSQGSHTLELGDITVLLGANGAGKSNLISFFNLVAFGMTGALQDYLKKNDVNSLLYFGPQYTQDMGFSFYFQDDRALDEYHVSLSYAKPERLYVSSELLRYTKKGSGKPFEKKLDGDFELALPRETDATSKYLKSLLQDIRVYQFHDTSDTARVKRSCYVDDSMYLRSDAGNLAAFLYRLKNAEPRYYERIEMYVRKVMPQFRNFSIDPVDDRNVRLNWTSSESDDYLFGPHQLSDGTLRFMALATLLLQPPATLPKVVILDEPELGLHPQAVHVLATMIKMAARNAQIIISTQSPSLVDEFTADQITVVERDEGNRTSVIKKLDAEALREWLDEYSLSELWGKNVLGGQP